MDERAIASAERKKLMGELCQMMKGNMKALVFKHDASRIVQTAVKRGNSQQRVEIVEELQGEYVNMAQSKCSPSVPVHGNAANVPFRQIWTVPPR